MEIFNTDHIHEQLQTRRAKLREALPRAKDAEPLRDLLEQVDRALEKIEKGSYGACEACHDPIEPERLIVDPLIRNCLDHLTEAEQRVLTDDLNLAGEVQKNLLPRQGLRLHGWETAYYFEPAGSVSGDYCDLIEEEDCVCFFVGDVSGKGVAASLLMTHLHAIFRSLLHARHPFERLMDEANRLFCEGTLSTHFATLVSGRASRSGEVIISNAGHVTPLIIRNGRVETVAPTGIPLGMFCNSQYTTQAFQLGAGDTLLLYTDGVTEARNSSGEFYGELRLTSLLERSTTRTAGDLLKLSVEDLSRFRSGQGTADDVTLMVLKRG